MIGHARTSGEGSMTRPPPAHPFGRLTSFGPTFFPARPVSLLIMAIVAGAFYTLYLFPLDFLAGSSAFWESPPSDDWKDYIIGMRYYLGDGWHFPILRTVKMDPPDGVSIVFTDSLPLFAV